MVSVKNKAYCLLEAMVAISILTWSSVILALVLSDMAQYTFKTKMLLGAIDRAIVSLESGKESSIIADPYEITVQKKEALANGSLYVVEVSWQDHDKKEHITLSTVFL